MTKLSAPYALTKYIVEYANSSGYGDYKYDGPLNTEKEFWARIQELEYCLAEIYHRTSCTTHQMGLINKILPQE